MILIIIRLKRSRGGLLARRRWRRNVEVGTIRRARPESKVLLLKRSRWRWETAHEEVEDDKRSRRVFGGDLEKEIACIGLRKDRDSQVDWYSGPCGGYPLKEDVVGYLGDVRSNAKSTSVVLHPGAHVRRNDGMRN